MHGRAASNRLDLNWAHGPISGPVNGALGAVFLAALARLVALPAWLPLVVAAFGALAAVLVGVSHGTSRWNIAFRAACWLSAGTWAGWTIWQGWSLGACTTLAIGALFAGLLVPAFAPRVDDPQVPAGQTTQQPALRIRNRLEDEWAALITKVCALRDPVEVRKLNDWPGRTGYTLNVEFAAGSPHTWETLRDNQLGLAAARRLPPGCPINVERSDVHQGAAILHVSTVNDMKRNIDFPTEYSAQSIRSEFPIGLHLDKSPTMVELYQSAGIVAGQRGGGKTVILQVMNAQLARCTDAVIWHVDLNGGGMSSAWLTPYALGEVDAPTVDWVACSPGEAILMARVGNAIAKDRKRRYQRLMIERDTDILPVAPDLPAIIIVVDEGGEVTGEDASAEARQAAQELRELQRIGRAMCVNVVFSVQRATGDYVPTAMKKATALSIITRVKDQAEIAYLMDWKRGLSSDDLLYPGCAYIKRDSDSIRMYKGFGLLPRQIGDIARATTRLRPAVDAAGAAIGGKVYAQRWDRPEVREFLAGLAGGQVSAVEIPETAPQRQAPIAPSLMSARDHVQRLTRLVDDASEPEPEDEETPEDAPPPFDAAARRALMVSILDKAGADGMETADIVKAVWAAGVICRRQTVSEWLAAELQAGTVFNPKYGVWMTARQAAA